MERNIYKIEKELFITSDEEIKKGDLYLDIDINKVCKNINPNEVSFNIQKKIILTTDQDLIKDGVQAIDDNFLEWFVKNPSCKEVEIDRKENLWFCCDFFEEGEENYCINSMPRCPKCNTALGGNPDWTSYKIIIPKEKPKQVGEYQQELFNYLHDLGVIALQSEMQEIERIVLSMQQEQFKKK